MKFLIDRDLFQNHLVVSIFNKYVFRQDWIFTIFSKQKTALEISKTVISKLSLNIKMDIKNGSINRIKEPNSNAFKSLRRCCPDCCRAKIHFS